MHDIQSARAAPVDWGAAFAALPPEDASTDAWPRMAARLDAQRASARRPLSLSLALAAALVAYARDDQVASGSAATLSARYDARIADIDAALAQSDLTAERQRALWQARVGTLRDLAAFEANRRWLATQGERYDGALVRVD